MLLVLRERVDAGAERSEVDANAVVLPEEAEVDARRDDAAVCLEGARGDVLAAFALEVDAMADGGPGMRRW